MKIYRPSKGLIFDLADCNNSFGAKLLLMFLGGIGTFLLNILGGKIVEAFFAPASHLYSVAASAKANIETLKDAIDYRGQVKRVAWFALGVLAAFQAMVFGIVAYVGTRWFRWGRYDSDYDILAAHALGLWKFPGAAKHILQHGMMRFPKSVLLKRRMAHYFVASNDQDSLMDSLEELEVCYESENQPETKLRIARTLITGWRFLGDDESTSHWEWKSSLIPGVEDFQNQLLKLRVA